MSRRERRDGGEAPGRVLSAAGPGSWVAAGSCSCSWSLPAAATVVGGCSGGTTDRDDRPDPLIALADAARADAALAAAAIAADPALVTRIDPLREARTEHAAALDAEVVRMGGCRGRPSIRRRPPRPRPRRGTADTAPARDPRAGAGGGRGLAGRRRGAGGEPAAERVGLVASVAACCATYAAVLA